MSWSPVRAPAGRRRVPPGRRLPRSAGPSRPPRRPAASHAAPWTPQQAPPAPTAPAAQRRRHAARRPPPHPSAATAASGSPGSAPSAPGTSSCVAARPGRDASMSFAVQITGTAMRSSRRWMNTRELDDRLVESDVLRLTNRSSASSNSSSVSPAMPRAAVPAAGRQAVRDAGARRRPRRLRRPGADVRRPAPPGLPRRRSCRCPAARRAGC